MKHGTDNANVQRGIYVKRTDMIGQEFLTTFDIRVVQPHGTKTKAMSVEAMRTIEHIADEYFKQNTFAYDNVLYFGCRGHCTGFALIMRGNRTAGSIVTFVKELFAFIGLWNKAEGNSELHYIEEARMIAINFYLDIRKGHIRTEESKADR